MKGVTCVCHDAAYRMNNELQVQVRHHHIRRRRDGGRTQGAGFGPRVLGVCANASYLAPLTLGFLSPQCTPLFPVLLKHINQFPLRKDTLGELTTFGERRPHVTISRPWSRIASFSLAPFSRHHRPRQGV